METQKQQEQYILSNIINGLEELKIVNNNLINQILEDFNNAHNK